jgi:hypothetical protein
VGEPQTQLCNGVLTISIESILNILILTTGMMLMIVMSVYLVTKDSQSTLQGRCENCVHSGKDCICPFVLYVLCVSFAVVVVGVDSAPSYGLVVDRAPQPY